MLETITMEKFRTYPRQKSWRVKTQGQMTALDRIRERLQQEVDARQSGLLPQDSPSSEDRGLWGQSAIRHAPPKTDKPLRRDSRSEERISTIHKLTHAKRDLSTDSFGVKRSTSLQKPAVGRRSSLEPDRKVRPCLASPKVPTPAKREYGFQQKIDAMRKSMVQSYKPAVPRSQIGDSPDKVKDGMVDGDGKDSHDDDTLESHDTIDMKSETSEPDSDHEDHFKSGGYRNGFIKHDYMIHVEKKDDEAEFAATEDTDVSDIERESAGDDYSLSSATRDGHDKTDRLEEAMINHELSADQEREDYDDPTFPRKGALSSTVLRGYMINKDSEDAKAWTHPETSEDDSASEVGSSDNESSPELYPEKQSPVDQEKNMKIAYDTDVFDSGIVSENPEEIAGEDFDKVPEISTSPVSEITIGNILNESVEYHCSKDANTDEDEIADQLESKDFSMGNLLGKYIIQRDVPSQKDDTHREVRSEVESEILEDINQSDLDNGEDEIMDDDTDSVFNDNTALSGEEANVKEETSDIADEVEETDAAEKTLASEEAFSDHEISSGPLQSDVKIYFHDDFESQKEDNNVVDLELEKTLINDEIICDPKPNENEAGCNIEKDIEQSDKYKEVFIDHLPEQDVCPRKNNISMDDPLRYEDKQAPRILSSLDIGSTIWSEHAEEDLAPKREIEVIIENSNVVLQNWGFRVDPTRPFTILQYLYRYVVIKLWRTKARHYALSGRPLWLFLVSMLARLMSTVGLYVLLWMFKFFCVCLAICIATMIYTPYILGLIIVAIGKKLLARYGHHTSKDFKILAWWLLGELSRIALQVLKYLAVLCLHGLKILGNFMLRKIKESKYGSKLKRFL